MKVNRGGCLRDPPHNSSAPSTGRVVIFGGGMGEGGGGG